MPLRRIEFELPDCAPDDARAACDDLPTKRYHLAQADGHTLAVLLVEIDDVEQALETLSDRFGDRDGFGAVVLEVAASLPTPDPTEDDDPDAPDDDKNTLSIGRVSRDELLKDLAPGMSPSGTYLVTVALSTIIAAVGLIKDSPAVVIGAMVIAPLLLPNMSLALGSTLGDLKMIRRSGWTNAVGVTLALALSTLFGAVLTFDASVDQIASRTTSDVLDVALALAAGTAGAIAVTSGVSANLIGVMVAVALLPPLVATGLLLGTGSLAAAGRAGLLVLVNVACVNLAAVLTFAARGVRPSRWYDEDNAKLSTRVALACWGLVVALATAAVVLLHSDG